MLNKVKSKTTTQRQLLLVVFDPFFQKNLQRHLQLFFVLVSLLSPFLPLPPVFSHDFCCPILSLSQPQFSPLSSYSSIILPLAPSLQPSSALALSICLNLANFLISASSFIDLYGVILSMEGKDFFDTPKDQTGHKSHG